MDHNLISCIFKRMMKRIKIVETMADKLGIMIVFWWLSFAMVIVSNITSYIYASISRITVSNSLVQIF